MKRKGQNENWTKDRTSEIWEDVKQNAIESTSDTYNSIKDSFSLKEFKNNLQKDLEDISFASLSSGFGWGAKEVANNFSNPEIQSATKNLNGGLTLANVGVLLYNGTRLKQYSEEMAKGQKAAAVGETIGASLLNSGVWTGDDLTSWLGGTILGLSTMVDAAYQFSGGEEEVEPEEEKNLWETVKDWSKKNYKNVKTMSALTTAGGYTGAAASGILNNFKPNALFEGA